MWLVLTAIDHSDGEPAVVWMIIGGDRFLGVTDGVCCLRVVEDAEIAMVVREQAEGLPVRGAHGQFPRRLQHSEEGADTRLRPRVTERPIEGLNRLTVFPAPGLDDGDQQESIVLVCLHGKDSLVDLSGRVEIVAGEGGLTSVSSAWTSGGFPPDRLAGVGA